MTEALSRHAPQSHPFVPDDDTPVLVNRELRPGIDPATISRFGDNRWHLSPAVHEDHYRSFSLNFQLVPAAFRRIAKVYVWMELNHDHDWVSVRRSGVTGRGAVYTLHYRMPHLRSLLHWLTEQEISSLADVTHQDLDRYLEAVRDSESNLSKQAALLNAVRRLWVLRDLLPPDGRLPEAPPWKGKDNRILLGRTRYDLENRTRRIPEPTMSALLCWSLRFVEDFSDDILAALGEYRPLVGVTERRTSLTEAAGSSSAKAKAAWLADRVDALLDDHRHRGEPLPGRALLDGTTEPDWMHIARLIGCSHLIFTRRRSGYHRDRILASGVPVADAVYLRCRPRGVLDERLWLERIRYDQVPQLVRALHTACFVVLAYLSCARPGEVLTLERGCVSRHPRTGLWQLTGRKWKGATDFNGVKIPEGQLREDPWIVIEPVARAVSVLEQLHDSPKLFPVSILMARSSDRDGTKSTNTIAEDLHLFVEWVNTYCRSRDRGDGVPVSAERLSASRFRRTLAWFICRRPRGLVAAAIQYGHLHVQITQGYSGSYASGFPDDIAFERWLARLDELDEADRRLNEGGHVSGPAADAYRSRVAGGASRFAGRVIRSGKAARHVLANPSLQIYPGRGMTCVFNAATALCELAPSTDDARHNPRYRRLPPQLPQHRPHRCRHRRHPRRSRRSARRRRRPGQSPASAGTGASAPRPTPGHHRRARARPKRKRGPVISGAAGEPTPPAELCDRLRAAADRLLAGTPLHSDGKLTILSLAQEAGIKRWLLTHKHPHQLQAKYQAEFKAAQHKPAPAQAADREIERLRGELSKARDDRRHHEQLTRAYALIINQLTEELEATKTERDALLDTPTIARLPRRLPI